MTTSVRSDAADGGTSVNSTAKNHGMLSELVGVNPCLEGIPLTGSEDEGGTLGILGIAEGEVAAGQLRGLHAVPAIRTAEGRLAPIRFRDIQFRDQLHDG